MIEIDFSKTKHIKAKPPRCEKCWYLDQDDPYRYAVSFEDPEDGGILVGIICPTVIGKRAIGCMTVFKPKTVQEIVTPEI